MPSEQSNESIESVGRRGDLNDLEDSGLWLLRFEKPFVQDFFVQPFSDLTESVHQVALLHPGSNLGNAPTSPTVFREGSVDKQSSVCQFANSLDLILHPDELLASPHVVAANEDPPPHVVAIRQGTYLDQEIVKGIALHLGDQKLELDPPPPVYLNDKEIN